MKIKYVPMELSYTYVPRSLEDPVILTNPNLYAWAKGHVKKIFKLRF